MNLPVETPTRSAPPGAVPAAVGRAPETDGPRSRLPWSLAWRLAVGQIVAWGILYYTFTVVADPLQAQTGWSRTFINTGLSIGLLLWGLGAYPAGLWIQRRGAGGLMALASAVGGAALLLMAQTASPALYQLSWALLGTAMAGLLYDPAFAVITQAFGSEYRRGITLVTLVGGLASTVFIPIAQLAVEQWGWRTALVVFGLVQIGVGVPLHAWGIPRPVTTRRVATAVRIRIRLAHWAAQFRADMAEPRFRGLALWFAAHSSAFTGMIFQLMPMLQAGGTAPGVIVRALMWMGPFQVAGRFLLATRGAKFSALRVGGYAMAGLLTALTIVLLLPPTALWLSVFAALFGLSNGVLTIARGTVVAELYGRERYAELNGALVAPATLAKAAAPLSLAAIWAFTGRASAVAWTAWALVVLGLAGWAIARRPAQTAMAAAPTGLG
jgi:MFS family permease